MICSHHGTYRRGSCGDSGRSGGSIKVQRAEFLCIRIQFELSNCSVNKKLIESSVRTYTSCPMQLTLPSCLGQMWVVHFPPHSLQGWRRVWSDQRPYQPSPDHLSWEVRTAIGGDYPSPTQERQTVVRGMQSELTSSF